VHIGLILALDDVQRESSRNYGQDTHTAMRFVRLQHAGKQALE
jgi:hypothetical protein